MSALQSAFKSLGPIAFSDVPTDQTELDTFVTDLFSQSQLILESIPLADSASPEQQVTDKPLVATSASEIKLSVARSAPPVDEYASLQKEWGKPIKLGAKENPLGMSVYKTSSKDGKGAWFARKSVHEGLGFSKFKKCLQEEFEESLATHGPPGEGNVRGIGGEERVERIVVPGRGTVEVFRLSAQFPGPTTPRDFITLLVTSDNAMMPGQDSQGSIPRHYMMISKPVDHPDTQPKQGFVRGSYESVEFIREVPRKLKTSMSTTDIDEINQKDTGNLGKDAMIRSAHQKIKESAQKNEDNGLPSDLDERTRSVTAPQTPISGIHRDGKYDESNPVEWIMVTRSDPGGSVPRFMVERGTPGSICADASKFLDWACQQDTEGGEGEEEHSSPKLVAPTRPSARRGSFQSFRSSRLAGLDDRDGGNAGANTTDHDANQAGTSGAPAPSAGFMGAVVGAVSAYTPQVVLNHLPGGAGDAETHERGSASNIQTEEDDSKSILSSTSFQSAEDRISSSSNEDDNNDKESEVFSNSSTSSLTKAQAKQREKDNKTHAQHEKELEKIEQRRAALETKFAESRSKLDQQINSQSAKEEASHKKAMEKRQKELEKHEEKHAKEMAKLEERAKKERAKLEEKERKQEHKNEVDKVARERDDARREAELAKREIEMLHGIVADLQKENAALLADLGRPLGLPGSSSTTSTARASSDLKSESASLRTNRSGG